MAGQAAAEAGLDAAERQVDLVVHHHHVVEVDAQPRAGLTDLPDSFMYVCGRSTPTAAGSGRRGRRCRGPPSASCARQAPALGGQRGHLEPMLWRVRA